MHLSTVVVPRNLRFRFCDIRAAKWLVPAWRCFALPLADKRNRFLVPLWVFCFGMEGFFPLARRWVLQTGHSRCTSQDRKGGLA